MAGDLDREYAIWVSRDELGKKKEIHLEGSMVTFMLPAHIDGHIVLRLKGLGYRRGSQKGNLLVRINLMEEERDTEWFPFHRTRGKTTGNESGPFSQNGRYEDGGGGRGWKIPFMHQEVIEDPMRMRRAGYLILCAGLILISGASLGILPVAAWAGVILIVSGIIVAYFA